MPTIDCISEKAVAFEKCGSKRNIVLICMALIVMISAVYMQVGNHQFLSYDDAAYVTSNPHVASGFTGNNIIWAFTSVDEANWHPITWLSHMADVRFYGMNPRGHHLTNVVIHTASTLLLFLLLLRLTGGLWQSAFVAALFALHPLHVESVAWVAERKDVLSALFWFLTLLMYAEFTANRKPALYFLSLFFFMLGLMSKPMLVTLPVVMLLIDFWPLNRFRSGEQEKGLSQHFGRTITLVKEKIPFFACSLVSCVITIYAQNKGGATSSLHLIPFMLRIENALVTYVMYIYKTLWPHDLAVLYLFPSLIPLWKVFGSLIILLFLTSAAIRAGRRHPFFAVGWFWFLVTLLPVIGLIHVGNQSMADRYSYIPVIGLFIMAAWGVPVLTKGLRHRERILALLAGTVIITSAALTWHQLGYWRDTISLYRHTLQVTTDNYLINYNLGLALAEKGDLEAAIQEYRKALQINPDFTKARNNLGLALAQKGDLEAAILEYRKVLQINPDYTKARNNLGLALAQKGDLDAAIHEYQVALLLSPNYTKARINLGLALAQKKKQDETRK